ncbi:MAG: hypothetical protein EZS28_026593 [Streblomastix strix]|uniref:J domain-containing protein n=1 Tax=Streblomastix strix TaxID=222440 RepID=A0A5J4V6S5_9EUKA|nr:MAG: hypothetical protein EZS28_026593 [Streblomastix strix]
MILIFLLLSVISHPLLEAKKEKDYYQILGVKKDATQKEIAAAYRELSRKFHPDKVHATTQVDKKKAQDKYAEIGNAYETLSKPESRREYDERGQMPIGSRIPRGQSQDPFGGFNPFAQMFQHKQGFDFGGFGGGSGGMKCVKSRKCDKKGRCSETIQCS